MNSNNRFFVFFSLHLLFWVLYLGQIQCLTAGEMSVKITSPKNGQRFESCTDITVAVEITVESGEPSRVYLYKNGGPLKSLRKEPWEYTWEAVEPGIYNLSAKVRDKDRNEFFSDSVQIFVDPIENGNLIINGEFACSTSPWELSLNEGAEATLTIEPEGWLSDHEQMVFVDITQLGSAEWHVMLQQPFPLDSGHVYEIYFFAEVEDQKPITINFQEQGDDYTVHHSQAIPLDRNFIEYGPYLFECQVTDPQNYVKIILGADNNLIFLDNIRIFDQNWEPNTTAVNHPVYQPIELELSQNYPNPFNPHTDIRFSIPKSGVVNLTVYDVNGRAVNTLLNERMNAGLHTVQWDGTDDRNTLVSSGVYFYKLQTNDSQVVRRMVFLK